VKNNDFFPERNSVVILDELAHRIRESRRAAQEAGAALLHHSLDAGDALNEAQKRVSTGWKNWLRQNCFLSVRSALVYQQLAKHRAEIEALIAQVGELSLRGALRLISAPRPKAAEAKAENAPEPRPPELMLSDAQLITQLTARGLDWFVANMPDAWREELQRRLRGPILRAEKARRPNVRMKHLKVVHSADSPTPH
jgi:hypothetical protein